MKTTTIKGTYGSNKTPCEIYTATNHRGLTWYAVEGSCNVNATMDDLQDGVDVEEVCYVDSFTWSDGIESEDQLVDAVES